MFRKDHKTPMRKKLHQQAALVEQPIEHFHSEELAHISWLLDRIPMAASMVLEDLVTDVKSCHIGRCASLTAEQALRSLILKQMYHYSYEHLAFALIDSSSCRSFCRIGIGDDAPSASSLQRAIKRIRASTMQKINLLLVETACELRIEKGRKMRFDTTVVESHIHHPTDSALLVDCVRVLSRLMHRAAEMLMGTELPFVDHHRRAKRRQLAIKDARTARKRTRHYRDLLLVTKKTVDYARNCVRLLAAQTAHAQANELSHYIVLSEKVITQTECRVLYGQRVDSSHKVVSVFEPHTDIIVKDRRDTYYGHKIALGSGSSGLITDVLIDRGNPSDASLATRLVQRQAIIYDRVPRQVALDGGFASKENLREIKALGVKDVAFHRKRGLAVSDMAKSTWVYKRLRNFRAGIEGIISFLKRCFGMRRCTWRGFESFKSYVWSSVVAANLLLMARQLMAT